MNHIAIDLGSRESQICIRDSSGTILAEERQATRSLGKYLAGKEKSRVVVESCAEAFVVADAARAAGHEVVVVPAMLVRQLGVGDRGLKNDVRDAQQLSNVSCRLTELPTVHIPSALSRERKAMCNMREAQIEARTKLVNTARSWLRTQGIGVMRGGGPETFPERFRRHVASRGRNVPEEVNRVLQALEALNLGIVEADKQLAKAAEEDPICKLLMTAPGIGPVNALRYAAALDDVSRFHSAHGVEAFLGVVPGENSTGESRKRRMTGITKAGPPRVRWALTQAAWSILRCNRRRTTAAVDPMAEWAWEVAKRRGKKCAAIALVRKLSGVLYAMWRDRKPYDPNHMRKAMQQSGMVAQPPAH